MLPVGHALLAVRDLMKLTRFWNLMILALAQFFTGLFLADADLADIRMYLLMLSTMAVAAGGYIINDYYDIKIDYVNKPERVVVGKSISRRVALLLHVTISLVGIFTGLLVHWSIGIINFACVFLLWWYSNSLKRLPFVGNLTVAFLTGSAIWVVEFAMRSGDPLVAVYSGFAFFLTLVREIVKDMEDWRGDTTYGCRTLPIVLGIRKTKWIVMAALGAFAFFLLAMLIAYPELSAAYLTVLVLLPSGLLTDRLLRADTIADFATLSLLCKALLVLGIGSMLFSG